MREKALTAKTLPPHSKPSQRTHESADRRMRRPTDAPVIRATWGDEMRHSQRLRWRIQKPPKRQQYQSNPISAIDEMEAAATTK